MNSTANAVRFKLNRTDVAIDPVDGVYENITSGTITFTYDGLGFATIDDKTTVVVPFTSVDSDGYIDATLSLDTVKGVAGAFNQTTICSVTTEGNTVTTTAATSDLLKIVGQQPGQYFDSYTVSINKNTYDENGEISSRPASQKLWTGKADVHNIAGGAADGVTLVYKLSGIETPIVADNFNIVLNNNNIYAWNSWNWQNGGNTGGVPSRALTFEKDGYYYVYINRTAIQRMNISEK